MKKNKFDLLLILKKLKKNKSIVSLNTLNSENQKLNNIESTLNQMLESSRFPENELLSSGLLRQISGYQNQLQEKITITHNRNAYIKKEIKESLNQLAKINKQTEKIEDKINQLNHRENLKKEEKSEITITNKPGL
tara:strand:- start:204 stop:611 length:408 start_codon:yes stop_codon:yes gene_type:complete